MTSRILILSLLLSSNVVFAAANCHEILVQSQLIEKKPFAKKLLQLEGNFTINGKEYNGDFSTLLKNPEIKAYLESKKATAYQILGTHEFHKNKGGGKLRLVTLELSDSNRAYNHQELAALLKVNPTLANKIGFFAVEGFENMVWAPDLTQTNHRLNLISNESGIANANWKYGQAEGVVSFKPYIELLANGKFPFSTDADVNLSVHDVMHAVSFAALNSTVHGLKVMEVAQQRNEAVKRIYNRIMAEMPELDYSYQSQAKMLSSDPMERTMLLTIQMTGNYGYFSPSVSRSQGKPGVLQNKEITTERVKSLLRLYTQGAVNFKNVFETLKSSLNADKVPKLKKIFQDEVKHIQYAREEDIQKAADEIVNTFFASSLFSTDAEVRAEQTTLGTGIVPLTGTASNFPYKHATKEENID